MSWEEQTLRALQEAGHRRGAARERVVGVLAQNDCCLTAPEIAAAAGQVGIASVYRVLDQLADASFVQRIELGDGVTRYERSEPAHDHHHHHVVCSECGRVERFEDDKLEAALRRVERETGFAVASHDVLLRGSCADCAP
ncbi:MAG: Fur family transcriptional regulator [Gaiellaceae bacterium]